MMRPALRPRRHPCRPSARPGGLALALLLSALAAGQTAPDERSSRADYVIRAVVDPLDRHLDGELTLTWTNRSGDTVQDLWFHLHLNAYSNNLTTHLWESRGRLRDTRMKEGWGWQRVTSMKVGDRDILPTLEYRHPDDERADDRTVFSVRLPAPVAPGASVRVDLTWDSLLPRVRRRTGVKDDFVFLAHWFPKLGVYEGGRGWNCHQFHASTEFYADYGTYDVTLDLPAEYEGKVAASGLQVGSPSVAEGRVVTRFAAPSLSDRDYRDPVASGYAEPRPLVHGFAWTADPDYLRFERAFRFADWKERFPGEVARMEDALGVARDSLSLRDVNVVVMIHPERESQWERHYEATCAALFFYGLWFGEYPYEQVTAVDPAWGARAAGGMEYPTLFTCGTRLFTRPEMYTPESVTVHECGHQFWYGLVGNNEYENAWMDEGFNSYTDSEALVRTYGPRREATRYSGLPVWGQPVVAEPAGRGIPGVLTGQRWDLGGDLDVVLAPLFPSPFLDWWRDQPWLTFAEDRQDPRWGDRARYLTVADVDPVRTDGWRYLDRESYSINSYPRPAVVLRSLPALVGDAAFRKGMRHYAGEWRYRHPYPQDFYESFQEGAGVDVGWYFEELLEGTGTVDWSVDVEQWRSPRPRGYFLEGGEYVEHQPGDERPEPPGEEGDEAAEPPVETEGPPSPGTDEATGAAETGGAETGAESGTDAGGQAGAPPDSAADAAGERGGGDAGEAETAAPGEPPPPTDAEADPAANTAGEVVEPSRPPGEVYPKDAAFEASPEGQEPEAGDDDEEDAGRPWIHDVVVRRRGTLRLPLTIAVGFDNGTVQRFEWTREAQQGRTWWRLPIEPGPAKIERVILDPDRRYYLDANMSDNQWYSERDRVAPSRWSERAFTQYVHLLHWFSSLGG